MNKDLHYLSASQLVSLLADQKISSIELLENSIARIEVLDKKINAIVVRDFENARIAAKLADDAIARGERKPLLGLPMTVKESFDVLGLTTNWANPAHKDWMPEADSLAVARLKAAGAIIVGKTNTPTMLMDWQTYNDLYGTTNNPWNLNYTCGGSSGGSAAALAAGFTSLELGSDLAGSIRGPAHCCGIYGHKPSVNLVPTRGSSPPTAPRLPYVISDLVVTGPMARSADDLALGLRILAGPDELWDGKGYRLALPPARHSNIKNFRVLVLQNHPMCQTSKTYNKIFTSLIEKLRALGVSVSDDESIAPDLGEISRSYVETLGSFVSGSMPIDEYNKMVETAKNLETADQSFDACIARGCVMDQRNWLLSARKRSALRHQWRHLYSDFDIVICPVMSTPAYLHDHSDPDNRKIKFDGLVFPYDEQYAWISIATYFGLPATVAPIGFSDEGLPIGIQIIGDYLEDNTTIEFASLLERAGLGISTKMAPVF